MNLKQQDPASKISELEQIIVSLNEELRSTNMGVVALYSELEDQAIELSQAVELKSRFLSYMSHEFKTPLSSILSIVNIMTEEMDGPLTDEQKKQVTFIQSSALELSEMVNDLLDLAKIEAGRLQVSSAWFKMVDLFSALRGMFRPLLLTDNVTLIFEDPNEDISLFTDDRKLSQVLRNFISNAIKFTPSGEIRVSAHAEGGTVRFAVADTGIGIPKQHHEAIFEDFNQINTPLQQRFRGTGLGLALSKRIAELLGGTLSVESEEGVGSTFTIEIPAHYAEAVTTQKVDEE